MKIKLKKKKPVVPVTKRPLDESVIGFNELVSMINAAPGGVSRRDIAKRLRLDPYAVDVSRAMHAIMDSGLFRSGWRKVPSSDEHYQELAFYCKENS